MHAYRNCIYIAFKHKSSASCAYDKHRHAFSACIKITDTCQHTCIPRALHLHIYYTCMYVHKYTNMHFVDALLMYMF